MGFLSNLIKKNNPHPYVSKPSSEQSKNYQDDSYYSNKVPTVSFNINTGESAMADVLTYEERIKDAIPSSRGLYPAEILLIFYSKQYHNYPNPKNGYPGLWWFKYGIRNVDAALNSLVDRGFLALGDKDKYQATSKGLTELSENEYVAFTHQKSKLADITPWTVNKLVKSGDADQIAIVQKMLGIADEELRNNHSKFMNALKEIDSETHKMLSIQDKQIAEVNAMEVKYKQDGDIVSYIAFWENIWSGDGLSFHGSKWVFRLPELYIKEKRYNDAEKILQRLRKLYPNYNYRADKLLDTVYKKISTNK